MKKYLFLVVFLFMFSLLACNNKTIETEERLNVDFLIDNGDSILTKQITKNKKKETVRMYLKDDYTTLEYIDSDGNISYEYYYLKNKDIFHSYNLSAFYENAKGEVTETIDIDLLEINNSFYKFKKILQLVFLYNQFDSLSLNVNKFYNDIKSNEDIIKTFNNGLSFYENIRNYYSVFFPTFEENKADYMLNGCNIKLLNNSFKMLTYFTDEIDILIIKDELKEYDIPDISKYKPYDADNYITLMGDYCYKINAYTMNDNNLLYLNSSYKVKNNVRQIYFYFNNANLDTDYLKIVEYESKNECQKVYNEFMDEYTSDELYLAYNNKCLFITNISNYTDTCLSKLNLEFKTPINNSYTDVEVKLVANLGCYNSILDENVDANIIGDYSVYSNVLNKIKQELSYVNEEILNIKQESFNSKKYIILQKKCHLDEADSFGQRNVKYEMNGIYLNGNELEIDLLKKPYFEQGMPTAYNILIYEIDKNINIIDINVNSYPSMEYFLIAPI